MMLIWFVCLSVSVAKGDPAVDAELRHICAFSFPAVLQIIGKQRWKEVREVLAPFLSLLGRQMMTTDCPSVCPCSCTTPWRRAAM